jgi:membrane protein
VIVLLFWLYLSFYIVLLGAEINAELELQTARDTTRGRAKPMGKRAPSSPIMSPEVRKATSGPQVR